MPESPSIPPPPPTLHYRAPEPAPYPYAHTAATWLRRLAPFYCLFGLVSPALVVSMLFGVVRRTPLLPWQEYISSVLTYLLPTLICGTGITFAICAHLILRGKRTAGIVALPLATFYTAVWFGLIVVICMQINVESIAPLVLICYLPLMLHVRFVYHLWRFLHPPENKPASASL